MASRKIIFCPKCFRPVEARDYFTTAGISDVRVEGGSWTIRCPECDYSGPPIEATLEEYKKLIEKRG